MKDAEEADYLLPNFPPKLTQHDIKQTQFMDNFCIRINETVKAIGAWAYYGKGQSKCQVQEVRSLMSARWQPAK